MFVSRTIRGQSGQDNESECGMVQINTQGDRAPIIQRAKGELKGSLSISRDWLVETAAAIAAISAPAGGLTGKCPCWSREPWSAIRLHRA